jgi:hypothetical protein
MSYNGKFKSFFERSASSPESWRPLDFSVSRSDDGFETRSEFGSGANVETLSEDFPPSDGDQCQMCGTHIIHKFVIQHGFGDGDSEAWDSGGRVLWAFVGSECITNFVDDVFSARLEYAKRTAKKEKRASDIERSEATLMDTVRSASNIMSSSVKAKILPDPTLFKKFGSIIEDISSVILNAKQALKNRISREEVEDSCLESLRILNEAFASYEEELLSSIKIETLREIVRALELDTFDEAMTMLGLGISLGQKDMVSEVDIKPMVDMVNKETMRRLCLVAESTTSLRDVAKFGKAVKAFKVPYYMFHSLKKIEHKPFIDKKVAVTGRYIEIGLSKLHAVMASRASELAESKEFKVMLFSISQNFQHSVTVVPDWAEAKISQKISEISLANLDGFSTRLRELYNRDPSSFYQTLLHITNAGEMAAAGKDVANSIDAHYIMKKLVEHEGWLLNRKGFYKPENPITPPADDKARVDKLVARMSDLLAKNEVVVMRRCPINVKVYGYRVKQYYVGPRVDEFSQPAVRVLEDEGFKFNTSTGGVFHESMEMAYGLARILSKIIEENYGTSVGNIAS